MKNLISMTDFVDVIQNSTDPMQTPIEKLNLIFRYKKLLKQFNTKTNGNMKTAIEEIIDASDFYSNICFENWFKKEKGRLKEKEKQQIIEAAKHGANFENSPFKNSEDYYNETFK
jgi:hypothetical protein